MKHHVLFGSLVLLVAGAVGHAAAAKDNWENLCARCHGADGKGQTRVGKKLGLKDYTEAKAQAEMTDDEMVKAISEGVKNEAGKEQMKGYKGELSPQDISELVGYIRKFKQ